jgi:ABC-2 type transport system permease protein
VAAVGADGSWGFGVGDLRDVELLQLMGLLQGAAFGMILTNSAAAIVTSFVLPTAFSVLANIRKDVRHRATMVRA